MIQPKAPATLSIQLGQPNLYAATPSFEVSSPEYGTSFESTPVLETSRVPSPLSNSSPAPRGHRTAGINATRPKGNGPLVLVWNPLSGEQMAETRAKNPRTPEDREKTKLIRRRGGACDDCRRNHRAVCPEFHKEGLLILVYQGETDKDLPAV